MELKSNRKAKIVGGVIAALVSLVFVMASLPRHNDRVADEELNMPHDYSYGTVLASNRMEMHYVRTRPSNVTLESIHDNVTIAPYYGVNGGFFFQDALLSIAVVNDAPVNADKGTYGTGAANVKYARGTLVWDGALDKLSVQVASQSAELVVSNRSLYWAQGGISMSLDDDAGWLDRIALENAPYPYEDRLRSGAVYDSDGYLYLIVSTTKGTLADFRAAILEKIGRGKLVNGIFLDGDGSSQLRSREIRLSGDGRPVVQMLRLVQ